MKSHNAVNVAMLLDIKLDAGHREALRPLGPS